MTIDKSLANAGLFVFTGNFKSNGITFAYLGDEDNAGRRNQALLLKRF
jgi:hypothetical protein